MMPAQTPEETTPQNLIPAVEPAAPQVGPESGAQAGGRQLDERIGPAASLESLAPRLGDALVREGLITPAGLEQALAWQEQQAAAGGERPLLGHALVTLGLIRREALDAAVARQLGETQAALQTANRQLEQRVQQRTLDLERRLVEIRTAAEITHAAVFAGGPADLGALFQRVLDLLVERFGLLSAAIFLVAENGQELLLAELATADPAILQAVRANPPRLPLGGRSLVGWAAANRRARFAGDVSQDFFYAAAAELSETRSEAAIPILLHGGEKPLAVSGSPGKSGTTGPLSPTAVGGAEVEHLHGSVAAPDELDRYYFQRQAAEHSLGTAGGGADALSSGAAGYGAAAGYGGAQRLLGVLDLQDQRLHAFDADRVAVLQIIADHLAAVIQNLRLLEASRLSLNETSALYRAGQELAQARRRDEALRILAQALERLDAPAVLLAPDFSMTMAGQPGSAPARPGDSTPLSARPLRPLRSAASARPQPARAQPVAGDSRPLAEGMDTLSVELINAALPDAPGSGFLWLDRRAPGAYPPAFFEVMRQIGAEAAVFAAVRLPLSSGTERNGNLAAVLVAGEPPAVDNAFLGGASLVGSYGLRREALVQVCAGLAELGAAALARLAAGDVMEKRFAALQSIGAISQFISLQMDLNDLYAAIHAEVLRIMGDVSFFIALYDPQADYIRIPFRYERGAEGEDRIASIPPFPLGRGLTSIVINGRKPLMLVQDTERRAQELGAMTVGRSSKSWLGVPLLVGGEVIGAMVVQDPDVEGRFDEDDQRLLATMGVQVATAIRTAHLLELTRRQAERQRLLNTITTRLRAANDYQGVLDTAAAELRKALGAARVRLDVGKAAAEYSGEPRSDTQEHKEDAGQAGEGAE